MLLFQALPVVPSRTASQLCPFSLSRGSDRTSSLLGEDGENAGDPGWGLGERGPSEFLRVGILGPYHRRLCVTLGESWHLSVKMFSSIKQEHNRKTVSTSLAWAEDSVTSCIEKACVCVIYGA